MRKSCQGLIFPSDFYQACAIVKACMSDGYSTNKTLTTLYGMPGEEGGNHYST